MTNKGREIFQKVVGPHEYQIQIQVCDLFKRILPNNVIWFHPANGEFRDKRTASKLKAMGVKPGIPDLILLYKNQAYFIELKRPGGYATPIQKEVHQNLLACGFDVLICKSIEDVLSALKLWMIPHKEITLC